MKFKREYMIGKDRKATEEDYIVAYIAENGVRIERNFSGNNDKNCWYAFGGEVYDTLKEAKAAVESKAQEAAVEAEQDEQAKEPESVYNPDGVYQYSTIMREARKSETNESKMTLKKLWCLTHLNFDSNGGDILGVAVYTNGGDTKQEFCDVQDVINHLGNREVEPVYIGGDFPASMTEPDKHGMIHIALVEPEKPKNKEIKAEWCKNWIKAQFTKHHAFPGPNAGFECYRFWKMAEESGLWERGTYGTPMTEALEKMTNVEIVQDENGKYAYSVFKLKPEYYAPDAAKAVPPVKRFEIGKMYYCVRLHNPGHYKNAVVMKVIDRTEATVTFMYLGRMLEENYVRIVTDPRYIHGETACECVSASGFRVFFADMPYDPETNKYLVDTLNSVHIERDKTLGDRISDAIADFLDPCNSRDCFERWRKIKEIKDMFPGDIEFLKNALRVEKSIYRHFRRRYGECDGYAAYECFRTGLTHWGG